MKKKVTVLNSIKHPQVKQLEKAFKEDPYGARILYMSSGFNTYCRVEKTIKEEYFDNDGNKIPNRFRIYFKTIHTSVTEDLRLVNNTIITLDVGMKFGRFYKRLDGKRNLEDFELVHFDKQNSSLITGIEGIVNDNMLTLYDIIRRENRVIFNEWISQFPWMIFMYEHNVIYTMPLNEVLDRGLTNLKKALTYTYKFPYPVAKKIHEVVHADHYKMLHDLEDIEGECIDTPIEKVMRLFQNKTYGFLNKKTNNRGAYKRNFFELFDRALKNRENFNIDWLFYENNKSEDRIIWNLLRYAILMDRKVDCKWSDSKVKTMNNKWTKEYASLVHKHDNRKLLISDVFVKFSEMFEIPMVTTIADLSYEGFKMNHCVGSYETTVSTGGSCIYSYGDYTLQLHFGLFSEGTGLSHIKRRWGIKVGYFTGFYNCEPSYELKKKVDKMITEFNRYLLTIPFFDYIALADNVLEGHERFNKTYPELAIKQFNREMDADEERVPVLMEEEVVMREAIHTDERERAMGRLIRTVMDIHTDERENDVEVIENALNDINIEITVDEAVNEVEEMYAELEIDGSVYRAVVGGNVDNHALLEVILSDEERNRALQDEMREHFGDFVEGDVITVEGNNGNNIDFIFTNGLLRIVEVVEVDEELVPEGNRLVDADGVIDISDSPSINLKRLDFMEALNEVLHIHCEVSSEREIPLNEVKNVAAVHALFHALIDSLLDYDYEKFEFCEKHFDLITDAVDSFNLLSSYEMDEIMAEIEHKKKLRDNPYYDLMDKLSAE